MLIAIETSYLVFEELAQLRSNRLQMEKVSELTRDIYNTGESVSKILYT
jgi:hypothetical protein